MFALLNQRCVRWFGHHDQTDEPWTYPKELMYGELAVGIRPVGRPRLPFKDLCKGDLKLSGIGITNWEDTADDRGTWKLAVMSSVRKAESGRRELRVELISSQTFSSIFAIGKSRYFV